jgi:hypothetical protein
MQTRRAVAVTALLVSLSSAAVALAASPMKGAKFTGAATGQVQLATSFAVKDPLSFASSRAFPTPTMSATSRRPSSSSSARSRSAPAASSRSQRRSPLRKRTRSKMAARSSRRARSVASSCPPARPRERSNIPRHRAARRPPTAARSSSSSRQAPERGQPDPGEVCLRRPGGQLAAGSVDVAPAREADRHRDVARFERRAERRD